MLRLVRGGKNDDAEPLLLPRACHGSAREASRRSKALAKKAMSTTWDTALAGDLVDVNDFPTALIVLDGPDPLLPPGPHFHVYWLARAVCEAADDLHDARARTLFERGARQAPQHPDDLARTRALVDDMLRRAWGPLCLFGQDGQSAVFSGPLAPADERLARMRSIFVAMMSFFPTYHACGRRYSTGLRTGRLLDVGPRALDFYPANLGLSIAQVASALRSGESKRVIAQL
jgi:hypothetical protein